MALLICKECGNQLSSSANSCPSCGKSQSSGRGLTLAFLIVVAIGAGVATSRNSSDQDHRNAAASVATPKPDPAPATPSLGYALLKKSLKDPSSLQLIDALFVDSENAVCFNYRAKNGLGALDAGQAIFIGTSGAFKTSDSTGFYKLWNATCANKPGDDYAAALRRYGE